MLRWHTCLIENWSCSGAYLSISPSESAGDSWRQQIRTAAKGETKDYARAFHRAVDSQPTSRSLPAVWCPAPRTCAPIARFRRWCIRCPPASIADIPSSPAARVGIVFALCQNENRWKRSQTSSKAGSKSPLFLDNQCRWCSGGWRGNAREKARAIYRVLSRGTKSLARSRVCWRTSTDRD